MKILFFLRFFPVLGGGEAVTLRLANSFVKAGHDVGIFYLWFNNGVLNEVVNDKISLFKIDNISNPINFTDFEKYENKNIINSMRNVIDLYNPDILINQWFPAKFLYKANKNKAKIISCLHTIVYSPVCISNWKHKIIKSILGINFLHKLQFLRRKQVLLNNCKYSDVYVTLSKSLEKDLIKMLGVKYSNKITSIPNPAKYDNWIDNSDITKKENYVLFVGRFSKEKRIELIIDIWNKLDLKKREGWKLVLCGTGAEVDNIINYISNSDSKDIIMTGFVEPNELYKKSKIVVLTSSYEGFPMVLVEGMQNGCVPISFNSFSAVTEIIKDKENGFIIDNNDINQFVLVLKTLMIDDSLRFNLLRNGIEFSKNYSIEKITTKWMNLFNMIINN